MVVDRSKVDSNEIISWLKGHVEIMEKGNADIPSWAIDAFFEEQEEDKVPSESAPEDHEIKMDDEFRSELVYFKVEDTTFTVIKEWIMLDGTPFHDMLSLPPPNGDGTVIEGTHITRPIVLEQTTISGFKAFLRLLYSMKNPMMTFDEWVSAFDLALRWNFTEVAKNKNIRKRAFTYLHKTMVLSHTRNPSRQIHLGRQFSFYPWLMEGLMVLTLRVAVRNLIPSNIIHATPYPLDPETVANVFYLSRELERFKQLEKEKEKETPSISTGVRCNKCRGVPEMTRIRISDCMVCIAIRHTNELEEIAEKIFDEELKGCIYKELDDFQ